jgi:anti-sigma regulatory factor (Ser/Thr protein kinase)
MFYSETLPKSSTSAAIARDLLARVARDMPAQALDDARLLVSELVANAVEHVVQDGEIEVRIEVTDRRLRVEVHDPGPGFTHVPRANHRESNDRGWGLVFAERIATRWANEPGLVWFELDRS